jgi:hypothetical protein
MTTRRATPPFYKFRTRSTPPPRPIFSLNDAQLDRVLAAARLLSPEKRDTLLQRVAAEMQFRAHGGDEIDHVLERALRGLLHGPA